jgi:hypothetical protein
MVEYVIGVVGVLRSSNRLESSRPFGNRQSKRSKRREGDKMLRPILVAMLLPVVPVVAFAQPATVAYQGRLLDASGMPALSPLVIQFAIFDAATGGNQIWCEEQTVALSDGYYAVRLGEGTPCASPSPTPLPKAFAAPDRHLELAVQGAVLSPRQRIGAVPFAFVAASLANGDASFIRAQTASKQAAGFNIAGSTYVTGPAPFQGSGTVDTVQNNATVTGHGTLFGTEVMIGDLVVVNGQARHVVAISSPTSLTLEGPMSANNNAFQFQVQKVVAQFNTNASDPTASAAALVVNQAGSLGIGTTNPKAKLEVVASGANSHAVRLVSGDSGVGNWLAGVAYLGQGGWNPLAQVGDVGLIFSGGTQNSGNLVIGPWSASPAGIRITSTGNVGIGTSSPDAALHVSTGAHLSGMTVGAAYPSYTAAYPYETIALAPTYNLRVNFGSTEKFMLGSNGTAYATVGWTTYSDVRLKTDVESIPGARSKALALRGVTFKWKESGAHSVGFIAQEVEKVLPEVVSTDPRGLKAVDYSKLTPLLVEALKDQEAELELRRQDVDGLRSENRAMALRLSKLERALEHLQVADGDLKRAGTPKP